jgi:hypothetical protein
MKKCYNYYTRNLSRLSRKVNITIGVNLSSKYLFKLIELAISAIIRKSLS